MERIVKSRLTNHFSSSSNNRNHEQSAYCKHRFAETAHLHIYDTLAMSSAHKKYHVSAEKKFQIAAFYLPPANAAGSSFGRISVSVCLSFSCSN